MKSCYTTYGGPETAPAIADPMSIIFCDGYKPRNPNVTGQGLYQRTWRQCLEVEFKKWGFSSGYRSGIEKLVKLFGLKDL